MLSLMSTKKKETVAKWHDSNRKVPISSLVTHSKGRFANLSNDKTAWKKIVVDFNLRTGLDYNKGMLTTQCVAIKKNLAIFDKYVNQSGFGIDSRGVVTGSPESLNAYYVQNPKCVQFADSPLPFYDELLGLFGSKFTATLLIPCRH